MAQRFDLMLGLVIVFTSFQPKKPRPRIARPRDGIGDGSEASIGLPLPEIALIQDGDFIRLSLPFPDKPRARSIIYTLLVYLQFMAGIDE